MVYVFLANGFEDIEAISVVDILRRAKINVNTVSVDNNIEVTSAHNVTIKADMLIDDVNTDEISMIVLPGGMPCTENLIRCEQLANLIHEVHNSGKYIAAISSAPWVLAHLGLLMGKRITSHPDFKDKLTEAEILPELVYQDGQIITSKGTGTALHFAYELVKILKDANISDEIRNEMQVPLFF